MRRCVVCEEHDTGGLLCPWCRRSYDKMLRRDDSTIEAVILWAVKRTRWFAKKHQRAGTTVTERTKR